MASSKSIDTNEVVIYDDSGDKAGTVYLTTDKSTLFDIVDFVDSDALLPLLMDLPYEHHPEARVRGMIVHQRRDIVFYSNESKGYKYAGQLMASTCFSDETQWLLDLMERANSALDTHYNGILINKYVDGSDYVSAHSDDERGLSNGQVAAISVGSPRTFRVRDKVTKEIVLDIQTISGNLLVMDGAFQSEFKHEIPATKKNVGTRISLTFRQHSE